MELVLAAAGVSTGCGTPVEVIGEEARPRLDNILTTL